MNNPPQECCAHLTVVYKPTCENHVWTAGWICAACGCEFKPVMNTKSLPENRQDQDQYKRWPKLSTVCSVCGKQQYDTPGGPCCKNGHGGADGIVKKENKTVKENKVTCYTFEDFCNNTRNKQLSAKEILRRFYDTECLLYDTLRDIEKLGELADPDNEAVVAIERIELALREIPPLKSALRWLAEQHATTTQKCPDQTMPNKCDGAQTTPEICAECWTRKAIHKGKELQENE